MPKLVSGQFDPTQHKAVWPSTGNYCRGGVAVSRIMGAHGVAVLPEGMSREAIVVMAATDTVICLNGHICCTGNPESVARSPEYLELFGSRAAATRPVPCWSSAQAKWGRRPPGR